MIEPRAILELLPHGVLVVASDWRVVFANPEAERILLRHAAGATLWERCPELEHTAFASGFRYAMADRTELLAESPLPSVGWCQARALPVPDGLVISIRQVHPSTIETGQAKQALMIGELGDALAREESLDKALDRCARAIVRNLEAAVARIWVHDELAGQLVLAARGGLAVAPPERLAPAETKVAQIAEDGTPYLTNEVATDPHVGGAAWLAPERIASFAGYPLRIEDRIVGVIEIYWRRAIDHAVLNSLAPLADALALGIERKRAAEGRRRAEERLRAQAEQLAVLHELGKQLAAELDVEVLARQVTAAATRLAGAELGAFVFHPERRRLARHRMPRAEAFGPVLARVLASDRAIRVPCPELALGSVLGVPVHGRGEPMLGAILLGHSRPGAFDDATEQLIVGVATTAAIALDNARLFEEARELIAALENRNHELDQFAYVASHDLKAPLRGIANLAQWIEEDLGDAITADTRTHLELLRGRVGRLEYLIAGILAYARAGREPDAASEQPLELAGLAREAWELLAPPPTARLSLAPDLPHLVGSRAQLQQVLMNLLGNAIKYNPDRELHVELGARAVPGSAGDEVCEILVRDDGIGIAPEFHARIWGLFQTLERRDKLESTGIGLSIVRKIVEARGGRAWVESRPGGGATFYFTWPNGDPHG